ncbi:integrin beta-3-like [Condylostylus longicornis]|uniref:integrin beta-3-like n=1 Tax=Condylostylus longicornis TaxID=2530218 RepID=UPI00244E5246|nr:integrin beta-3-like [Condylostylus longicornis]
MDELRKHKSSEHSNNTILQENYVAPTITSSNNENQIVPNQNGNLTEFSQNSKNINGEIPAIETKSEYSTKSPVNINDVALKEKPEPSAPLLPSSNEYVITQQPPPYMHQEQPYTQQSQRQQYTTSVSPIYSGDPCCICCCRPTIHCGNCCCDGSSNGNVVDGAVPASNDEDCIDCCCDCCCHSCRAIVTAADCKSCDCDCGDCDCNCGDCDCGDCDCGDCDCGNCDCDCGSCSIM